MSCGERLASLLLICSCVKPRDTSAFATSSLEMTLRTSARSAARESRLWLAAVFDGTSAPKAGIAETATMRTRMIRTDGLKRFDTGDTSFFFAGTLRPITDKPLSKLRARLFRNGRAGDGERRGGRDTHLWLSFPLAARRFPLAILRFSATPVRRESRPPPRGKEHCPGYRSTAAWFVR